MAGGDQWEPPERARSQEIDGTSIEVLGIELHASLCQHFDQLVSKAALPMMLFLSLDVRPYSSQCSRADREGGIALLPGESRDPKFIADPNRTLAFDLSHEVGEAVCGPESDQKMHMVRDSTDGQWHAAQSVDRAAQISMQPVAPLGFDEGQSSLGRKDDVITQAQKSGRDLKGPLRESAALSKG